MSNLTAQQVYENTRGSNSPENREKRAIEMFGHKQKSVKNNTKNKSKSEALKRKISEKDRMTGGHKGDYEKARKAFLKSPLHIKNQFNKDEE